MSLELSNIDSIYTTITINNDNFVKIKQNDKYFVFEELYIKYIDISIEVNNANNILAA